MNAQSTIDILKKAILLEKRGKAFYHQAAENAADGAVKRFFELMATEEAQHIEVLSKQYKQYLKERKFVSGDYNNERNSDISSAILSDQIKQKISAADFEAAAISAAVAMEERAVKFYSEEAAATAAPEEKALYNWLTAWEREHLKVLIAIDRELTEKVWYDNQFWPF